MGLFFGQNKITESGPVTSNIKYGRLYNWYAVNNALFAPSGWHVATKTEYETLITYIGGNSVAGGKLKETGTIHWFTPNTGATNEYGFNAVGNGARYETGGFGDFLTGGQIWTKDLYLTSLAYFLYLQYNSVTTAISTISRKSGMVVRLVKNDSTLVDSLTDLDGNIYNTVKINNQVWTAQNWACTKLNNGTFIPKVIDEFDWSELLTGAYCSIDNDDSNVFL